MGQHRDIWHANLAQAVDRANRLRHLHQGEDVLLHARATRGRDADQRHTASHSKVGGEAKTLAHHAAHRAAHESEIHHGNGSRASDNLAASRHQRVAEPRCQLGIEETIGVRLEVDEGEWVGRA